MDAILLSVLSGLLLTAGFPKPEMFYLTWIAFVPLLWAARGRTGKEAFLLGYLAGLVHSVTCLFWIRYAIYHYGGFSYAVSLLILLLLACIMAVYPAVFALVARKWERAPFLYVFALPFVWVTLEWARAHAITGFPWSNLGYTQMPFNRLVQVADITGVYGISFLLVLCNTVIAGAVQNFYRKAGVAFLAACVAVVLMYGFWRPEQIRNIESRTEPFTVGIVQGNIAQDEKWDPSFQDETIGRYELFSMESVKDNPKPDLIFWPESAMPFFYGLDEKLTPHVNDIVQKMGKPLLFGSLGVAYVDGKAHLLNRAYLVDENAHIRGAYAKQHLVPFGEYVPYSNLLFFVHHIAVGDIDFMPGKDPGPLLLGERPMGILICYEAIFPDIGRATVRKGAQVLMNMTNDAWYGDTGGPYQHLEIARLRSIEFRVPLVRAANTGVSAAFDATGRECGRLALNTAGFLNCTVHPMPFLSFYAEYGDLFAWFAVIMTICAFLFYFVYYRILRRKSL